MRTLLAAAALMLATSATAQTITGDAGNRLTLDPIARFDEPWAIAQLDDTGFLVTEKSGSLWRVGLDGQRQEISGVPAVAYGGQGGLGDVTPHPDFAQNGLIYLSAAISDDGGRTRGAAVFRATLNGTALTDLTEVWRQTPFTPGRGHFSHRIAFAADPSTGKTLMYISSGDRQLLDPAQDMGTSIGKIIRLYDDGSVPPSNPFADQPAPANTFYSTGHRNALGLDFAPDGTLWSVEMGPADGDELNIIQPAQNYGWPVVSEGNHYDGRNIPNHNTRPEFEPPVTAWVPTIAPSSISIMPDGAGDEWAGQAFVSGLRSQSLFRLDLDGTEVTAQERFPFRTRLRAVLALSDDQILILEDGRNARLWVAAKTER